MGGVVNYGWPTCLSNTCLFACAGKLHDRTQLPTKFIHVMQHLHDRNRKGPHLSFRQMEHESESIEVNNSTFCLASVWVLQCVTGGDACGNQQSPSWNLSPPHRSPLFPSLLLFLHLSIAFATIHHQIQSLMSRNKTITDFFSLSAFLVAYIISRFSV